MVELKQIRLEDLVIDSEFENLIRKQTPDEAADFEYQMINHGGAHDPIMVWDNGGTYIILDGHHRYWFLLKHPELNYRVEVAHEVHDRLEAGMWILRQQRGKKNLKPFELAELALKFEPMLKAEAKKRQQESGGDKKSEQYKESVMQNSAQPKFNHNATRDEVARIAGVSHDTIDKTKKILAEGTEEQINAVRSGEKSINKVFNEIKSNDIESKGEEDMPLTEEQKIYISEQIESHPEKSYRQIAKECGTNHQKISRFVNSNKPEKPFIDGAKLSTRALNKRIDEDYQKMINPEDREYTEDDAADEFEIIMNEFMSKLRRVISVRNNVVKGSKQLKSLIVMFSRELKKLNEEI